MRLYEQTTFVAHMQVSNCKLVIYITDLHTTINVWVAMYFNNHTQDAECDEQQIC